VAIRRSDLVDCILVVFLSFLVKCHLLSISN
jgi:hypothetical protein